MVALPALRAPTEQAADRARLGLDPRARLTTPVLSAAFRRAALAAHPDRPGGDADRFREIVDAHRRLSRADAGVGAIPPAASEPLTGAIPLRVTPLESLTGATVNLRLEDHTLATRLPVGVRDGDRLTIGDRRVIVVMVSGDGLIARGGDLYMDWPVSPRRLAEGGRLTIETHAGPRDLWLTPVRPAPLRHVLAGLGLPASQARPAGRLHIRLTPDAAAPTPAEAMLDAFEARWLETRRAA